VVKAKWQLATEETMSHIICMPSVTKEQIDAITKDISELGNLEFPKEYD
jgi:histidine decarboxylase